MTKWNMIDTKENGKVAIESLNNIELAKEFDQRTSVLMDIVESNTKTINNLQSQIFELKDQVERMINGSMHIL
jgi:TolA-binding protein